MMNKKLVKPTDAEDAQITAAALTDPDSPPLTDKEFYVLLLDQIDPYLNSQFCEIPQEMQERISLAGMGEKTNEVHEGVEEFYWATLEDGKVLEDLEAKEIEEGEGVKKGRGIRTKIKTEHYYIWDTLLPLKREYKVARYDFENYPGFREKATSSKLVETITPHLETNFSELPQEIRMKIAYADDFQLWNEKGVNRHAIAETFDIRMQSDSNPHILIGFYDIRNEWDKYAKKKVLLAEEAIPLMNGLDPESWEEHKKNEKGLPKDMIRSIDRCLEIAKAEEKRIAAPSEWLAWGRLHDLDKPTIMSHEWFPEPNVCMWEFFESAVNKHVEETNKSRDSHNEQESSQAKALKIKGIDKRKIMAAFQEIKWDYDHWGKNLANPSKKLQSCRVARGSKTASALWSPVDIGLYLLDGGVPIKKIDAVFVNLKDWIDEWQEKTGLERD